jgi:hypothetical protein
MGVRSEAAQVFEWLVIKAARSKPLIEGRLYKRTIGLVVQTLEIARWFPSSRSLAFFSNAL